VLFPHFQGATVAAVRDEVVRTVRRALELDSTQAQPHVARALLHQFEHQWDAAAREHETAVGLEPRNVEARLQYGRHLMFRGRLAEALAELRATRALDPESALVLSYVSLAFLLNGMPDSALVESQHALANDPANLTTIAFGSLVRLRTNRPAEARELAQRTSLSTLANYVLTQVGDTAEVRRQLREEEGRVPRPWSYHTKRAHGLLGLGDTAEALTELKLAVDDGEIWTSLFMIVDPMYDPVRGNGRFREILRRVGLEEVRRR